MEVGLLGPVTVPVGAGAVTPGKRARALLAVLLLAGPDPVPTDELVPRVWGDGAPPDAGGALPGLLDQLAAVLPEGTVQRTGSGHSGPSTCSPSRWRCGVVPPSRTSG